MDLMFIPFVVAFSTSGFVAWRLLKVSKDYIGMALGAAIAVFFVSLSITYTIVFIPFEIILEILAVGLLLSGFFAGVTYIFSNGKRTDRLGQASGVFLVIMFIWAVAAGFVAGSRSDYSNCHDGGPQGMYTVCE